MILLIVNAALAADPCAELGLPAGSCTTETVIVSGYKMAREAVTDNTRQDGQISGLDARVKKLESAIRGGTTEDVKGLCRDLRLEIVAGLYARAEVPDKWVKTCAANGVDLDAARGGNASATPPTTPAPAPSAPTADASAAPMSPGFPSAPAPAPSAPAAVLVMAGAGRDCSEDDRAAGNRAWCTPNASISIGVYTGGLAIAGVQTDSGEDQDGDGTNESTPVNDRQASWLGGVQGGIEWVDLGPKGRLAVGARLVGGADILGGSYVGGHATVSTYVDPLHHGKLALIGGYTQEWMGNDYAAGRVEGGFGAGWRPSGNLDFLAEVLGGTNASNDTSLRVGLTARWSFGL